MAFITSDTEYRVIFDFYNNWSNEHCDLATNSLRITHDEISTEPRGWWQNEVEGVGLTRNPITSVRNDDGYQPMWLHIKPASERSVD